MGLLTHEQLLAYKHPEPLSELWPVPELGGEVRLQGVTLKSEREAINAEVKTLRETGARLRQALGLNFDPDEDDLQAAAWVAACVVAPKCTSADWLRFANEGYDILGTLWIRALVCSRLIPDPAKTDAPETEAVPDGVDAAKAEIQEALGTDPLGSGGGSTATAT